MGFNNRSATPLDYFSSPLLPQADSSEAHNVPTAVSPTTAKTHDWIADIRAKVMHQHAQVATAPSYSYAHTTHTTLSVDPAFPEIEFENVSIGDIIILNAVGCAEIAGTPTTNCAAYIVVEWDGAVATYVDAFVAVRFSGSFAIHSLFTVTAPPLGTWSSGIMRFVVGGHANSGTTTLTMLGTITLSAIHVRRS